MTYYDNPNITDWQKQIILGTILGGSSLVKPKNGKNCYLVMRSSNTSWIEYKGMELANLANNNPFTNDSHTIRWRSNCYPIFNEIYDMTYKNKKKYITMEVLDILRDIGLMVWFGDSGKFVRNKIVFNTHKLGKDSTNLIAQYFKEAQIGECKVFFERGHSRLKLLPETTERFMLIIANKAPEFMQNQFLGKQYAK